MRLSILPVLIALHAATYGGCLPQPELAERACGLLGDRCVSTTGAVNFCCLPLTCVYSDDLTVCLKAHFSMIRVGN